MIAARISKSGCDLGLDENVLEILRSSLRELCMSLPVRMDDGKLKVFQGVRVQTIVSSDLPKVELAFILTRALRAFELWRPS
jgi:hypothetical protein